MDIVKNLISVVIPAYNVGDKVHRLFDSLLAQTYQNMEIIFVNDGSSDHTAQVAKEYQKKFEQVGISFQYLYQSNQGAAVAIGNGFQYVRGEFIAWPDADDWLLPHSFELKVKSLLNDPSAPLVSSNAYTIIDDKDMKISGVLKEFSIDMMNADLFLDCLLAEGTALYPPICHMLRTKMFYESNSNSMYIEPASCGQNWQVLLPMLYKYKRRIWIPECLGYYLISPDSHSRIVSNSLESDLARRAEHLKLREVLLQKIICDGQEYSLYRSCLHTKHSKDLIGTYLCQNKYLLAMKVAVQSGEFVWLGKKLLFQIAVKVKRLVK